MGRVTITVSIDYPEGAAVTLGSTAAALPEPVLEEAPWPTAAPVAPPPVSVAPTAPGTFPPPPPNCPAGHGPMIYKPAGTSQRTGAAYNAFWGCSQRECKRTVNG